MVRRVAVTAAGNAMAAEMRFTMAAIGCIVGLFLVLLAAIFHFVGGDDLDSACLPLVGMGAFFGGPGLWSLFGWWRASQRRATDEGTVGESDFDRAQKARWLRSSAESRLQVAPWLIGTGLFIGAMGGYFLVKGVSDGPAAAGWLLTSWVLGLHFVFLAGIGLWLLVTGRSRRKLAGPGEGDE